MDFRKAQGALEFLTTYAWAFLIILIMISALAYFGVLRPSKVLPDRCVFGNLFECTGYEIDYGGGDGISGQVKLQLRNDVGYDIYIVDDSIQFSTESAASYGCTIPNNSTKWEDKGLRDFVSNADCNSDNAQFMKGKKGKVKVKFTYYKVGASAFTHDVEGEIYATIR